MLEDVIDEAIERGRASGIKTGIKTGRIVGKNETIKTIILNMISGQLDEEKIREYTGIDKRELEKIKKSYNR